MNKNLAVDFSVDKENKTITVKREFEAGLPLVWDAYTKSEILDKWWAPKPWKARTKSLEFKEGGTWHYAMVGPNGEEHWAVATYNNIVTQKKFTGHDAFADANGNINKEMPQSKWDASFTPKGNNTLVELKITYPDLAQLEATIAMGFKEGLLMAMENLDELLPSFKK
ncbi:MAG: SRPBCC domain-containing protein [Bacteroidia bacterium]|nr:SRPBCC domain-containing protein [Bacteroidia bacterium]